MAPLGPYLMFSTVSSGMGATVWTAGRFLLVAPFTKLEEEERKRQSLWHLQE